MSFAITTEESRFTLQGALLKVDSTGILLVATDGHRLAYTHTDKGCNCEPLKLILPARAMRELGKLALDTDGAQIGFAEDGNHLFFRIGERLLIVRKITGNFPDYERVLPSDVLPSDRTYSSFVERAALQAAIARVAEFADERSHAMRVEIAGSELKLFAMSVDSGESEETVSCDYTGPDIEIGFNATYVMDFLGVSGGNRVEMRMRDSKSAGEFRPESMEPGEQYRYVIMPMRI